MLLLVNWKKIKILVCDEKIAISLAKYKLLRRNMLEAAEIFNNLEV